MAPRTIGLTSSICVKRSVHAKKAKCLRRTNITINNKRQHFDMHQCYTEASQLLVLHNPHVAGTLKQAIESDMTIHYCSGAFTRA
jgi:hypothetical protein